MADSILTTLSKDLNDYWASTTTAAGAAGSTTIVDTALMAQVSDWITDKTYTRITSGACDGEERKITALSSSTLTFLPHSAQIASGVTYEIHRVFTASEKRTALLHAVKDCFPWVYEKVRDESKNSGNWLLNGDVEKWTVATTPDYWVASGLTPAANTTATNFYRGAKSCLLAGSAGYIEQSWTQNDDLKFLRGQTVKFSGVGKCDTLNSLRLAIYDGTFTFSDYNPVGSVWTDPEYDWYVEKTIAATAGTVSFRVYHDNAAASSYIDDLRVNGPPYTRVWIGDLGLAQDRPISVSYSSQWNLRQAQWIPAHNVINEYNGFIDLPNVPANMNLLIRGYGYLDFLVAGLPSTSWTATLAIDHPQTTIVTAAAAKWLYQQMMQPNMVSGDIGPFQQGYQFWSAEFERRKDRFHMPEIPIKLNWGQR